MFKLCLSLEEPVLLVQNFLCHKHCNLSGEVAVKCYYQGITQEITRVVHIQDCADSFFDKLLIDIQKHIRRVGLIEDIFMTV